MVHFYLLARKEGMDPRATCLMEGEAPAEP
jgi:hypothetical protein